MACRTSGNPSINDPTLRMAGMDRLDDVSVDFSADGAGECHMTWGQKTIWKPIQWYGEASSYFNLQLKPQLPQGLSTADLISAARRLVETNQSLRTHYDNGPNGPRQRVHSHGQFTVAIYRHSPDGDPSSEAAELLDQAKSQHFRLAEEWPIRFVICIADDRPKNMFAVISHLAVDGGGLRVVRQQLERFLMSEAAERDESHRWQPVDQAKTEYEAPMQARSVMAVADWRGKLAALPPSIFDYSPTTPADVRYQRFRMVSPALTIASPALARSCQASTSSVFLTAASLLLRILTGHDNVFLQLIVGNRYVPQRRHLAAALAQNGLFVSELSATDVIGAIRRNHWHALNAYRHGQYDPDLLSAEIDAVEVTRGVRFDLTAYFNDARQRHTDEAPPNLNLDLQRMTTMRTRTTISKAGEWHIQDSKFFLDLETSLTAAARLSLLADTAFIPPDVIVQFLRGIETLLLTAATRPVQVDEIPELTGLRPRHRNGTWQMVRDGWIQPRSVEEVVRKAVAPTAVLAVDGAQIGAQRGEVAMFVADPCTGDDIAALHIRVMAELAGRTDAIAPDLYYVCRGAPHDSGDARAWLAVGAAAAGKGR